MRAKIILVLILALLFTACACVNTDMPAVEAQPPATDNVTTDEPASDNITPVITDFKYYILELIVEHEDYCGIEDIIILSWITENPCICQVYWCYGDNVCSWGEPEMEVSKHHLYVIRVYRPWCHISISCTGENDHVTYDLNISSDGPDGDTIGPKLHAY